MLSSGAVECRKCGAILGRMEAGVFVAGAVRLWGSVRYSCLCGRSYFYSEKLIDIDDNESPKSTTIGVAPDRKISVMQIVNELGKDLTPEWQEQKKRKA